MSGGWAAELAAQIEAAIAMPGETVIAVPNEARLALARRALERMSPGNTRVTFTEGAASGPPGEPGA